MQPGSDNIIESETSTILPNQKFPIVWAVELAAPSTDGPCNRTPGVIQASSPGVLDHPAAFSKEHNMLIAAQEATRLFTPQSLMLDILSKTATATITMMKKILLVFRVASRVSEGDKLAERVGKQAES